MNFTLKDIKKQFGEKTYSLGIEYVQKKRVQQIQRSGNLIRSQVKDASGQTYQQNTFIKSTTEGIQFQGTCSCPLILNCHHVAAVLMTIVQKNNIVGKNKNASTETPLSNWVQKLYSTVYPGISRCIRQNGNTGTIAVSTAFHPVTGPVRQAFVSFHLQSSLQTDRRHFGDYIHYRYRQPADRTAQLFYKRR